MKMTVLPGICAALVLAGAQSSAEHQGQSRGAPADTPMPQSLACAQERGAPLGQCSYRITRDEAGKTTVTVIFANGFKRGLFFRDGAFLKASVTMSGTGTNADWSLRDGTHVIHVDGQRYEVPDSVIAGH